MVAMRQEFQRDGAASVEGNYVLYTVFISWTLMEFTKEKELLMGKLLIYYCVTLCKFSNLLT